MALYLGTKTALALLLGTNWGGRLSPSLRLVEHPLSLWMLHIDAQDGYHWDVPNTLLDQCISLHAVSFL